jgi:succinyl-diaminopimelate desuccinylase
MKATSSFRHPVFKWSKSKAAPARRTLSRERFEAFLDSHSLDYTLKWHLSGEPFFTPVGQLANSTRDAVREVTGVDPEFSTGGGTSDGRFIAPSGAHVVEFGAVNTTIHKVNEQIAVGDIDAMRRVYVLQALSGW